MRPDAINACKSRPLRRSTLHAISAAAAASGKMTPHGCAATLILICGCSIELTAAERIRIATSGSHNQRAMTADRC